MSHTSPATFLVWSLLTTLLGLFLISHLWRFDRFKCLKWSSGPYSGAFKRVMTYTYLLGIPLIMVYVYGFSIIKYKMGFTIIPGIGFFPTPYQLWPKHFQALIFPLTMTFSLAWAFEMVTHLEELCFWMFLINAGPQQPDWFNSKYFRIWVSGSVVALIMMPLVSTLTRHNPFTLESSTFLAGSLGSLTLTIFFLPILYQWPRFLQQIKKDGVDTEVLVRLTKFYELNIYRVAFRFLFCIPFLCLAVDGLQPHTHKVNESMFWTDFLAIIGAIGLAVSSTITLLIFFPRSYEAEVAAQSASFQPHLSQNSNPDRMQDVNNSNSNGQKSHNRSLQRHASEDKFRPLGHRPSFPQLESVVTRESYLLTESPVQRTFNLPVERDDNNDEEEVGVATGANLGSRTRTPTGHRARNMSGDSHQDPFRTPPVSMNSFDQSATLTFQQSSLAKTPSYTVTQPPFSQQSHERPASPPPMSVSEVLSSVTQTSAAPDYHDPNYSTAYAFGLGSTAFNNASAPTYAPAHALPHPLPPTTTTGISGAHLGSGGGIGVTGTTGTGIRALPHPPVPPGTIPAYTAVIGLGPLALDGDKKAEIDSGTSNHPAPPVAAPPQPQLPPPPPPHPYSFSYTQSPAAPPVSWSRQSSQREPTRQYDLEREREREKQRERERERDRDRMREVELEQVMEDGRRSVTPTTATAMMTSIPMTASNLHMHAHLLSQRSQPQLRETRDAHGASNSGGVAVGKTTSGGGTKRSNTVGVNAGNTSSAHDRLAMYITSSGGGGTRRQELQMQREHSGQSQTRRHQRRRREGDREGEREDEPANHGNSVHDHDIAIAEEPEEFGAGLDETSSRVAFGKLGQGLTRENVHRHTAKSSSRVNPLVHSFVSPIDVMHHHPSRPGMA